MTKLIDLNGLDHFWDNVKAWVRSVLPTKVSQLQNDAHYVKQSELPPGSNPSTTIPKMDGTATAGSENAFARGDHRHPTDTSKQDVINDLTTIRSGAAAGATAYQKPLGGIPSTDMSSAVQTSLGKADTALQSYTETDPTVPSWAKADSKPTYTASEVGAIPTTDKGVATGVATLNSQGKIPSSQLPSYVDDIIEGYLYNNAFYEDSAHTRQITAESGKIYVDLVSNKTYRYSGTNYVEISASLALGETSSTAFAGDRGKAIEDKIPSTASTSNKLATASDIPTVPTISTDISADATSDTKTASPKAVKTYVDAHSGGTSTDVQVNGTSITNNGVANIVTNTAYNASSNKIATMSDIPSVSGKADKVSGATSGNFAGLDSNGNLTDSGSKSNDFATAAQGAKADTAYQKPQTGIPESDLSSDVQQALQKHFKGWYNTLAELKAAHTAVEGDSAYVKDASPATTWSIYVYDSTASSDNYWADSGTDADTSNVQTFASGEEVNETYIDDTHLDSPADGSLALAKDVKDFVFSDSAKTALVNLLSKVAFIDEHGQDYLNTLYSYLFPDILSINAVFTQGGAVIHEDDDLATLKQYLVVTALYRDGTTAVLPSNSYTLTGNLQEGQSTITVTYGDKTDTFIVTVTATPREVLFGVFTNGYAAQKGLSDNIQKCFRVTLSARATTNDPCENRGYVFTVTDSSKYNIAIYDVQSLQKQTDGVPSQSVDDYYYLGGDKTVSWKTQDSATTPYCWIALKKMDGTAFTAEELADGAAAVFTYTKNQ